MSYLDNTGLAYLWGKIKAAFAEKSHAHSASDVTSGTLPISRGGTGATTAAEAVENIVDGQIIKPFQINATGYIYTSNGSIQTYKGSIYTNEGDVFTHDGDVYTRGGDVIVKDTTGAALHKLSEKANTGHKHSASDITSGTLPVTHGGTGQDGTSYTAVVANVATAASGCTVTNAIYAQWGKVAQVFLGIKCNSAKSFNDSLATMVSGKCPVMTTVLTSTDGTVAFGVTTGGLVQAKSNISAGTTLYVIGTYLLP